MRFDFRPGTNEIWIGDVGYANWEEIDRIVSPTAGVTNFGWPCYEGAGRQPGYDARTSNICENLYAAGPSAVASPYYTYKHSRSLVAGETCATGSSSISGMSFYEGGNYPPEYDGALFFADYSRNCVWAMLPGSQRPAGPGEHRQLRLRLRIHPAADRSRRRPVHRRLRQRPDPALRLRRHEQPADRGHPRRPVQRPDAADGDVRRDRVQRRRRRSR